ncbi:uncharacterized protein CTHT_0052040 [Thermochaetoides thermophila DSM 1495]|uniref:Uncharacterized protein n=1 Tax=Chaetomium thermophilum (strain DSM 1495 / CBS 144.50 / IMI 039719) TaxID=759272 RepID=G0SDJ8_CHATD|nr:hypothetical protein CTHT_0052040 [Thermochaetoides thermophila DSM 1495]EGS18599.1 hypothetical protein CTHT_0052040 [Thermochaetoides thermophila DSM 1495]
MVDRVDRIDPIVDQPDPDEKKPKEAVSPSSQDRILDRKIERRALPETFSSNLARRDIDAFKRNISDLSARTTLSRIAESLCSFGSLDLSRSTLGVTTDSRTDDKDGPESSDDNEKHDKIEERTSTFSSNPPKSQPHVESKLPQPMVSPAQVGIEIEDYSLTLLKHKRFLNNRPLARCLDNYEAQEDSATVTKLVDDMHDVTINSRGAQEAMNKDTLSEKHDGVERTEPLKSTTADVLTRKAGGKPSKDEKRNSADVRRFWKHVRTYLWIDEDEIDGKEVEPSLKGGVLVLLEDGEVMLNSQYIAESDTDFAFPPAPNRPAPPPPVTRTAAAQQLSMPTHPRKPLTPGLDYFPDADDEYPDWSHPPPTATATARFSTLLPDLDDHPNTQHPTAPHPRPSASRPPTPPPKSHSRQSSTAHSSGSYSGPWVRPPTWRSPSIERTPPVVPLIPSSPPLLATLTPIPTPCSSHRNQHHKRTVTPYCHSRNRHQRSRTSVTSTSGSGSAVSIPVDALASGTPGSGTGVVYGHGSGTATRQRGAHAGEVSNGSVGSTTVIGIERGHTPRSSTEFMSPQASSGLYMGGGGGGEERGRRLTTVEKLEEIDAFLGPGSAKEGGFF